MLVFDFAIFCMLHISINLKRFALRFALMTARSWPTFFEFSTTRFNSSCSRRFSQWCQRLTSNNNHVYGTYLYILVSMIPSAWRHPVFSYIGKRITSAVVVYVSATTTTTMCCLRLFVVVLIGCKTSRRKAGKMWKNISK